MKRLICWAFGCQPSGWRVMVAPVGTPIIVRNAAIVKVIHETDGNAYVYESVCSRCGR